MQNNEKFNDCYGQELPDHLLQNSRIVSNRNKVLQELGTKDAVIAEVGTQEGKFAAFMLEALKPTSVTLFDLTFDLLDPVVRSDTRIRLEQGDSSLSLQKYTNHFDLIYVDGCHTYEGVQKDLLASLQAVKKGGWIVCNDFTAFSPFENCKYGVYRAVTEFCNKHNWEIVFLGLHYMGYHDVALREKRP